MKKSIIFSFSICLLFANIHGSNKRTTTEDNEKHKIITMREVYPEYSSSDDEDEVLTKREIAQIDSLSPKRTFRREKKIFHPKKKDDFNNYKIYYGDTFNYILKDPHLLPESHNKLMVKIRMKNTRGRRKNRPKKKEHKRRKKRTGA